MKKFRQVIAVMLAVSIIGIGLPVPAHAGMIGTDRAVTQADRARVLDMLDRAEVRAQLQALGVSASQVKARVNALSDAESAELAGHIESLPAGADAGIGPLVGAIVLVFLVLLITDLLGLTKVFPFTKPIR